MTYLIKHTWQVNTWFEIESRIKGCIQYTDIINCTPHDYMLYFPNEFIHVIRIQNHPHQNFCSVALTNTLMLNKYCYNYDFNIEIN